MQKKITRNIQKGKARYKLLEDKLVKRFWGNAARLERGGEKSKNKGKKS